ncbi:helix-turn-helix transcriptional regulator [Niveispirillum sp.]|uniref:ArsR/SmtB family transcription factor n=1 Tax=Niveispirillum sp. TaxID=1917217 RepID=UPI001B76A8B1|nr:metalloregulator ArsR/SmtB family transcription factor [Niveispirillum sp.]MBP7339457.1 helix-turn-helix transcriptional regulator [Niveispirillum sp.]
MPNIHSPPANLDRMFLALADPSRRAVLERLAEGPASVGELAKPFTMALPSLMQHLRLLEDCGLIRTEKVGRVRTCRLEPQAMDAAGEWIARQRAVWEARFDRLDAYLQILKSQEEATNDDPAAR